MYDKFLSHRWVYSVIGGGCQGRGGLSPPNLQPNIAVDKNAKLHSDVLINRLC